MVNYFDPHVKFIPQVDGLPPKPYRPNEVAPLPFQQIDTREQRERIANFYSCIARLDIGIGMLLDVLSTSGQADNTLVIVVGDHGAPFARGKTSCYEAGLKIPFLVRWPNQVPVGEVDTSLVSTVDILPTVLEAVSVRVSSPGEGRSLLPLLRGEKQDWRTHLYAEFFYHTPEQYFPRYSVRDARYKLILNELDQVNPILAIDGDSAYWMSQQAPFAGTPVEEAFDRYAHPPQYELYDLRADPQEFKNLANDSAYAGPRKALQKSLRAWMTRTAAP